MSEIKCTCRCGRTAIHHAISCPVYVEFYERQFGRKPDVSNPQLDVEARLQQDYLLYGACYYTLNDQGEKTRIDPTKLIMRVRGIDAEMVERAKGQKL